MKALHFIQEKSQFRKVLPMKTISVGGLSSTRDPLLPSDILETDLTFIRHRKSEKNCNRNELPKKSIIVKSSHVTQ